MAIKTIAAAAFLGGIAFLAPGRAEEKGLVAHEWGASTYVQGSDGVTLDGIRLLQAGLPDFVVRWSRWSSPLSRGCKEKPILYFYTERETAVSVRVRLPGGILTEWWPEATEVKPLPVVNLAQIPVPVDGMLAWNSLRIVPKLPAGTSPRAVPPGPYAGLRETDAAWVLAPDGRGGTSCERFLLYRGMNDRSASSAVRAVFLEGGKLEIRNEGKHPLGTALLVEVSGGQGGFARIAVPEPGRKGEAGRPARSIPLAELGPKGRAEMIERLVAAGLFLKEAEGMMRFWTEEWFAREGVRILWLTPRAEIDRELPLEIRPEPAETVRVMVSCLELSTPEREREIERLVKDLGAESFAARERAQAALSALGRFAEPFLRRVSETSSDPEVAARIGTILAALDPRRHE